MKRVARSYGLLLDEVPQKSPCVSLLGRQENAAMMFGKMRGGLNSSKPRRSEQLLKRDLLYLEPNIRPKPIQDLREISQCFIAHVRKMAAFVAVFNPRSRWVRLLSNRQESRPIAMCEGAPRPAAPGTSGRPRRQLNSVRYRSTVPRCGALNGKRGDRPASGKCAGPAAEARGTSIALGVTEGSAG
jgi:hypothetical protein